MVAYHRENGGWLREADLAEFAVELGRPVTANYAGIEVNTCGPWCQGPVLAMMLGLLEGSDLRALGHNSAAYIHHLTEAMKLVYADRHSYFGDPNFVDVPIHELIAKDYLSARRHLIDPKRAAAGMPEPGKINGHDRAQPPRYQPAMPENAVDNIDTSYICVIDSKGNVFSATPSDGSSAAPVIPGLGFVPSSRGVQSWIEPNMPAVAGPLRRPRLTPSPAILSKPSEWVMPIGSPGNDVQAQAMLQVLLNIHLWGMTPQQAVEAPRFATFSFPRSSAPHSYDPGLLRLESRMPDGVADELRALGHDVKMWPDWEYAAGAVCTIVADHRSGIMEGGSDPRRPTAVLGW
jgi:gamma-glutamyltranspeptidase/glutathione hydrolase